MENIQQIVVQINSAHIVRALAQYGTDFIPSTQIEIEYDSLTSEDKVIWDAFVLMIKSKQ